MHPLEVEWAERVCDLVPSAERMRFALTGTEATQLAFRLALAATGGTKILRLAGQSHGWHDYELLGFVDPFDLPSSAGSPTRRSRRVVVADANPGAIEAALATREIAALVLEPGGASASSVPPDRSLLIFDEVVSGFRFAPGCAQEWFGVAPDVTTLGKIVAGGATSAAVAVAGRQDVLERMAYRDDAEWNRFSRVVLVVNTVPRVLAALQGSLRVPDLPLARSAPRAVTQRPR
jgi:glutamate-1-semialdehyde 2,1-aminomutase